MPDRQSGAVLVLGENCWFVWLDRQERRPFHAQIERIRLNPKTETDLTTDYADDTDTIGYDYQCSEVLPRKDSYAHLHNLFKNL